MDTQKEKPAPTLTQNTYVGTAYEDSSWEIVGEFTDQKIFEPMEIAVQTKLEYFTDPMFADYGGVPKHMAGKRYHMPHGDQSSMSWHQAQKSKEEIATEEERVRVAELEITTKVQAALEQGRKEGEAATMAVAEERVRMIQQRLEGVMVDFATQIIEHRRTVEKQALEFSLQIAERLVGTAVEINPEYVITAIQEALALSGGAVIKSIRVSPQDYEFLKLVNLAKHFKEGDVAWEFEADQTIRAGCIIQTNAGEIDYQLDHTFERIRSQVMKIV